MSDSTIINCPMCGPDFCNHNQEDMAQDAINGQEVFLCESCYAEINSGLNQHNSHQEIMNRDNILSYRGFLEFVTNRTQFDELIKNEILCCLRAYLILGDIK